MLSPRSPLIIVLLSLTALHLLGFAWVVWQAQASANGLLLENGNPAGGDFINLWSAGQLVLQSRIAEIYDPFAFMQFEQSLTGGEIGVRLWAYPPHSLLLAAPVGGLGYYLALVLWSALGLAVLAFGLGRLNFGWPMVVIGTLSPAALQCVYFGQTGNLAAGLLLIALTAENRRDGQSAVAAAILTIKPQLGLLLPVFWLVKRQWWLILTTAILAIGLMILSVLMFGLESWQAYLSDTVPFLSAFEAGGSGAFMLMIPSVFMSLRVLGFESPLALQVHMVVAGLVFAGFLFGITGKGSPQVKIAICLIATSLITPYLHTYDMSLLLIGGLLLLPGATGQISHRVAHYLVLLVWALPHLMFTLNSTGWPLAPLVLLGLFAYALVQQKGRVSPA